MNSVLEPADEHPGKAIRTWQQAACQAPERPAVWHNLGVLWSGAGAAATAAAAYGRSALLDPGRFETLYNFGVVLQNLDRLEEALAVYRRAVALAPASAAAWNNLGGVLEDLGHSGAAVSAYGRAAAVEESQTEGLLRRHGPRHNIGLLMLQAGRYEEGWAGFECRATLRPDKGRHDGSRWDGAALDGKILLVHAEQGLGDTMQFLRYLPLAADRGARIVLEVQPELVPLLRDRPEIWRLVTEEDGFRAFDAQIPLLSLPGLFGAGPNIVPFSPYIHPDPGRAACWAERLGAERLGAELGGFRVGLVWAGNPSHHRDRQRSVPLGALAPLGRVPKVTFYALQKGAAAAAAPPPELVLVPLGPSLNDLAEAAAAIAQLDLVVTVDTALAHLGGAMGREVWVLLPFAPDWRWGLESARTPWYPSMRLFRQKRRGDWAPVAEEVAETLALRAADYR